MQDRQGREGESNSMNLPSFYLNYSLDGMGCGLGQGAEPGGEWG